MILSQFKQWNFSAFPDVILISTDKTEFFSTVLLLFVALSAGYLFFSYMLARFLPARRQKVSVWLSMIYTISIMLISFEVASQANSTPFMPLLLACALALLNTGFIISLCGSWFTNNRETSAPVSLFESVRANYWLTLLSTSLLLSVIFIQVPIIAPENHTAYWAPVVLTLLLYYLLMVVLINHSSKILGLRLEPQTLSGKLETRYKTLDQFIQQQGDYQLVLLNKGFRNALALFPHEKIFFGIDLLEHLTEKEIHAIALHEIGHLQDKKYIPLLHRINQFLPFLIVTFVVADQGNMFPSFLFQMAVFIAGIILFSVLFKRLRIKCEFAADTFVKDFPGDFHPHLISGIKQITSLNGLDKDFCKTHNYGHLDIDEREQMVKDSTFTLQRKPVRKFFLIIVPAIIFGVLFQFGWSALFPSKTKQWKNLHNLYHEQKSNYNFDLASETIHKTLDFSLKNFGEFDRRTYLSLKHIASTTLRKNNLSAAEQYILRAGRIGEEIYGAKSLRRNGEWRLLARIRVKQDHREDAKQIYTTLLSLQREQQDTPWNLSRTLYSLAKLSDEQQTIGHYQEIVQLYKETAAETDNSPSEHIFSNLAEVYTRSGQPERAEALLVEAVEVVQEKRGAESEEYGNILWELANLLIDQKQFKKAETAYRHCMAASLEMDPYISIGCQYGLGDAFRRQGLLEQAEQETHLSLTREEDIYGKESKEILFGLEKLAQLAEEAGNLSEEEALRQRARIIDEKAE